MATATVDQSIPGATASQGPDPTQPQSPAQPAPTPAPTPPPAPSKGFSLSDLPQQPQQQQNGQQPQQKAAGFSLSDLQQQGGQQQQPQQKQDGQQPQAQPQQQGGDGFSVSDLGSTDPQKLINDTILQNKTATNIQHAYVLGHVNKETALGAISQLQKNYQSANPDEQRAMEQAEADAEKENAPKAAPQTSQPAPAEQTLSALLTAGIPGIVINKLPVNDIQSYIDDQYNQGKLSNSQYADSLEKIKQAKYIMQNDPRMRGGVGLGATTQSTNQMLQAERDVTNLLDQAAPNFLKLRPQQAATEIVKAKDNFLNDVKNFLLTSPIQPLKVPILKQNPTQTSATLDDADQNYQDQVAKFTVTPAQQQQIEAQMKQGRRIPYSPEYLESQGMAPKPGAEIGGSELLGQAGTAALSMIPMPWDEPLAVLTSKVLGLSSKVPMVVGEKAANIGQAFLKRGWQTGLTGFGYGVYREGEKAAADPKGFAEGFTNPVNWVNTAKDLGLELGVPTVGGALLGAPFYLGGKSSILLADIMRSASPEITAAVRSGIAQGTANPFRAGQNLVTQAAGRTLESYLTGAGRGIPFAAAEQAGQQPDMGKFAQDVNQFGLYNALLSAPTNVVNSLRGSAFDSLFAYRGEKPDLNKAPAPTKYGPVYNDPVQGLNVSLDPYMAKAVKTLDPSRQASFYHLQDVTKPYADVFMLPDNMVDHIAQTKYGAQIGSSGFVTPRDPATGRMQVFIKASQFDPAAFHETMGHVAYRLLDPADQAGFQHLISRVTDMDGLANTYAKTANPNLGRTIGMNDLPTEAEIDPNNPNYDPQKAQFARSIGNLTKERAYEEAAAEHMGALWSGDRADNWTKSPSLLRQFAYYIGSSAERMGVRATTPDVDGPLGVAKGVGFAKMMDAYLRDFAQGQIPQTGAKPGYFTGQGAAPGGGGGGGVPLAPQPPGGGGGGFATAKPAQVLSVRTIGQQQGQLPAPQQQGPPPAPGPQPQPQPIYTPGAGEPSGQKPMEAPGEPQVTTAQPQPQPDPTVVAGLMKRGFTRAQAEDFAMRATVNPAYGAPRAELVQPQPTPPQALPIKGSAEYHQQINQQVSQGIPHGQAQANVEGRPVGTGVGNYSPSGNQVTATEFGYVDRAAVAQHPEQYPSGNKGFGDFGSVDLSGANQKGVSLPPEAINAHFGNVMTRDASGAWHADPKFAAAVRNHDVMVEVTNQATGQKSLAPLVDIGPGPQTGAGLDVLHGTAQDVGFTSGKAPLTYRIAGGTAPQGTPYRNVNSLADAAVANVGRLNTTQDAGTQGGALACADAVTRIVHDQLGINLPKTTSTAELYSNLRKGGWQEVDPNTPGAVIVSPTQGERHGHTGIVGEDGKIYSNSSRTGLWGQNYTVDSWKQTFGGLGVHAFVPGEGVGRVAENQRTTAFMPSGGGVGTGGGGSTFIPTPGFTSPTAQPTTRGAATGVGQPVALGGGQTPPAAPEAPITQPTRTETAAVDTEPQNIYPPYSGYGGAPAAPGVAFMPSGPGAFGRSQAGGIPLEQAPGVQPSTLGIPNPGQAKLFPLLSQSQQTAATLTPAIQAHAESLSPDDTRVKKQADNLFKGEHFQAGDELHTHILGNVPDNEKHVLSQAQNAIANRQPMHISYASAPKASLGPPTTKTRQIEYQMSSPQARMLGTTKAQVAGHSFIPTSVGVSLAKKHGEAHQGYIQGVSTNAVANNHHHLNTEMAAMGHRSPYPNLDEKFTNDLGGYVANLNAGYLGTGEGPAPETEEYPNQIDPLHHPYHLERHEAHFLNAVVNNQAAKAKSATGLRELAKKGGTLLTPEGETNPIRHAIDKRQAAIRRALAEEHPENPILQKAAQKLWSQDTLEPTIRTFKAGLVHAVHPRAEAMPEAIRPGHEFKRITETLGRTSPQGRPDIPMSVGFMPMAGKKAKGYQRAWAEGKTFETPLPGGGERFEISDRNMKLKPAPEGSPYTTALEHHYHETWGEPMPLHQAIDHPELFDNYPQLRRTKISMNPEQRAEGYYEHPYSTDEGKQRGNEIHLKEPQDRESLAHELQHAVQYIEGHPAGSSPERTYMELHNEPSVKDEVQKAAKEQFPAMSRKEFLNKQEAEGWGNLPPKVQTLQYNDYLDTQRIHRRDWTEKRMRQMAYAVYRRDPGEMEAKVAGERAKEQEEPPEGFMRPEEQLRFEHGWTERNYPQPPELGGQQPRPQSGVAFMPAKAAEGPLEKPKNWGSQPEEVRQDYLEKKVARTLANQYRGPETHKLEVDRNEQGGIKYDPAGNPVYKKRDYNIVNSPLLKKKGLDQIKDADEHEDTIDENQHQHLNQVERRRLSAMRDASAVATMGDKIAESYLGIKDISEIAAGEGWYSRMRQKLADALGEHHELFAQLLGATSAKTPVRNNFIQSLDALEQYKNGDFDRHIEKYLEAYNKLKEGGAGALVAHMKEQGVPLYQLDKKGGRGEDVDDHKTDAAAMANWIHHHDIMPKQKSGQKYNANSMAVLRALAGTWLHEVQAPKTPNFAGNLTGRSLEATIDVWAARHLQRLGYEGQTGKKPWRAQGQAEPGVSGLDFAFSQDAMRHAADKLSAMGHPMNPDDLQAILWFAEKHHYEDKGWTRGAGAKKSSFDDVADLAFPKSGKPMTSEDLQQHYGKIKLAKKALEYESHANPKMRAKMEPYMKQHGIEHHHLEAARAEAEPEEEEEEAAA
jgi:hypothetical protein